MSSALCSGCICDYNTKQQAHFLFECLAMGNAEALVSKVAVGATSLCRDFVDLFVHCRCHYREEAQAVQEEQQYHKLHQKQVQAQQESAWMHSVPEWHNAELVGQNKPWTVPSQLLTAEEEVRPISVLGMGPILVLGT